MFLCKYILLIIISKYRGTLICKKEGGAQIISIMTRRHMPFSQLCMPPMSLHQNPHTIYKYGLNYIKLLSIKIVIIVIFLNIIINNMRVFYYKILITYSESLFIRSTIILLQSKSRCSNINVSIFKYFIIFLYTLSNI